MTFYLKLTEEQAKHMIEQGISDLFGDKPRRFVDYTYSVEDTESGDKYWCISNYFGYRAEDYVNEKYPELEKYDHEYVKLFLPTEDEL